MRKSIYPVASIYPYLVATLLALAAWAAVNWPVLLSLHQRWMKTTETYALGYPVLAIGLWWLFDQRQQLRFAPKAPAPFALLPLAAVIALGFGARLVQFQTLQQMTIPVSLWLLVVLLYGWRVGRLTLFSCALLYSAIPLWDFLVDPLRQLTVVTTQALLHALKVPAIIEGFRITLPAGEIVVADGCSGLNLLLAAVVIGVINAKVALQQNGRRIALVAFAIALGIVDNWIRVSVLVLIGHYSEMRSELVYHHANFGWWVFAISLLPFFLFSAWLARGDSAPGAVEASAASTVPAAGGRPLAYAVIGAAVMLAMWVAVTRLEARSGSAVAGLARPQLSVPLKEGWLPHYTGYDVEQRWFVLRDGMAYEVAALTYLQQRRDKKLIFHSNRIADEFDTLRAGRVELHGLAVNRAVIVDGAGGTRAVWWFYRVDGRVVADALQVKLRQLHAMLAGDPSAQLVTVSRPCDERDCAAELKDEAGSTLPALLQELAALPDQRAAD